ncbi:type II toxin-antitoxin system Phd/YefM family antitoxin [Desulfonema magnum]|uniref:Antitoxin n=1 Tax=Desulfonema magnum TaxID=45655 RepID=A0A975GKC3_9BACT|nr:type II toxin-antitoxin system Phd/YefM family antitoxin [Desulfonema magnum]QTA84477.1 Toxin-antitoxin system, antitoxin component [Desulfonema magnum]
MNINIIEAQPKLHDLINQVSSSHKPVIIKSKESSAVLISQDDWESIQETLYLVSVPGMRESIREGLDTPIEECRENIEW